MTHKLEKEIIYCLISEMLPNEVFHVDNYMELLNTGLSFEFIDDEYPKLALIYDGITLRYWDSIQPSEIKTFFEKDASIELPFHSQKILSYYVRNPETITMQDVMNIQSTDIPGIDTCFSNKVISDYKKIGTKIYEAF